MLRLPRFIPRSPWQARFPACGICADNGELDMSYSHTVIGTSLYAGKALHSELAHKHNLGLCPRPRPPPRNWIWMFRLTRADTWYWRYPYRKCKSKFYVRWSGIWCKTKFYFHPFEVEFNFSLHKSYFTTFTRSIASWLISQAMLIYYGHVSVAQQDRAFAS